MTKYPEAKLYNISFSDNFLSVFSIHLLEQKTAYNDLVLLPTLRACRKLERYFFENKKEKLFTIPQLVTFSDLINKPYVILESCPNLDIALPKVISNTDLYFLVCNVLKKANLDISLADELLNFTNKFYTFCNSAEQIPQSLEKDLLLSVESALSSKNVFLEAQVRKIISDRIIANFRETKQHLHLVIPVEDIPYTRNMMKHLGNFSNVYFYFNGLDKELSEAEWDMIDATHPQWNYKHFLIDLKFQRSDVVNLGQQEKSNVISTIMTPNSLVHKWKDSDAAIENITPIICENIYQEATIISYIIREHLELGFKSIAVVSDDSFFNSNLKSQLLAWQILANDTNASSFKDSLSANLFLLCSELLVDKSPIKYLAVLKHPLSRLRETNWYEFEIKYLRKPIANFDIEDDFPEIKIWLDNLKNVLGKSFTDRLQSLKEFVLHFAALEENFLEFLDRLAQSSADNFISLDEFLIVLSRMMASERVRYDEQAYDTVTITSLLEARLLKFDLVIVPKLNHPFPKIGNSRFFIQSAEAQKIGLPKEDVLIGYAHFDLSAHLVQKSFISRSEKEANESKTPALIFEKVTTFRRLKSKEDISAKYFEWYELANQEIRVSSALRPVPNPKVRPDRISISGIEKLMENPYGYYAQYILGLRKLDPIDYNLSNKEFGTAIHNTMRLAQPYIAEEEYISEFKKIFSKEIGAYANSIIARNFWLPRIEKIAKWVWQYESEHKDEIKEVQKEQKLNYEFDDINVFAIADRIEYLKNNNVKVIDYKTGNLPQKNEVDSGIYPQLPIEGLIVSKLSQVYEISGEYHALKTKNDPAEIREIKLDLDKCEQELNLLIQKFLKGEESFFAVHDDEEILSKTRDYFHLSRVREWFD